MLYPEIDSQVSKYQREYYSACNEACFHIRIHNPVHTGRPPSCYSEGSSTTIGVGLAVEHWVMSATESGGAIVPLENMFSSACAAEYLSSGF